MKPRDLLRKSLALAMLVSTMGIHARDQQPGSPAMYRLLFGKGKVVEGLRASAIKLPLHCMTDGTLLVSLFDATPIINAADAFGQFLAAIPPSGNLRQIRLSAASELHGIREIKHCVSDSGIVFLVRAFGQESEDSGGERHFYAVIFDPDGRDHHVVKLDEVFHFANLAAFKSGLLLAYGYDEITHAPKLALLKDDGSVLKYLEPEDGTIPESAMGKGPSGKGPAVFIAPTQFVAHGDSILLVQNQNRFPLLNVSEGGAVKVIRPKLRPGDSILMIIPSDGNLFAIMNNFDEGLIYEIDAQDGSLISRIEVGNDASRREYGLRP